ncbi:MAG: hypothetical protein J6F30_12570 [Cellulosilyticum sp.]|nr:hypothetical protein [Cellulosilyticum sp.]
MKKLIGVVAIVVVVGGYIFMTKSKYNTDEITASQSKQEATGNARIGEIEKIIDSNYPTEAKEIVQLHNDLMGVCYKYPMNYQEIKAYTTTIRKIYSQEFKDLNSEENQIAQLKKERETMGKESVELVASDITETYVAKDDSGEEVSAEINVIHATNAGSTRRTYFLIKENGMWKINGWEVAQ